MEEKKLNPYASYVIKLFVQDGTRAKHEGITVNPLVSELASWYEKLRNAMDYVDDEVVLRLAIERILRRRLLLGGSGPKVADPLIRELIWARYFPDGTVPEKMIEEVEKIIDAYIAFRDNVRKKKILSEKEITLWTYHLLSASIERLMNPHREKDGMAGLIYHIFQETVTITDDTTETRNAQVFIAVRRAYAKDDLAFLRYYLFQQYYQNPSIAKIPDCAENFQNAHKEIEKQLKYRLQHRIFNFVRRKTPPFFILEEILKTHRKEVNELIKNEEEFKKLVFETCEKQYTTISSKVRRALVRSVIFLLITKTIFALVIEGTYERLFFGGVLWGTMAINVVSPPILMIITSFFIKIPDMNNSKRIYSILEELLFDPKPDIGGTLRVSLKPTKKRPFMSAIFSLLWIASFIMSFGLIALLLTKLEFNIVSQGVFIFFLAIVSFLSLRINRTARSYTVVEKPSALSTLIDFFLLPIAQVGSYFAQKISQVNIFLFILDMLIETPFKAMFGFVEQWLLFIHSKREYLE